MPIETILLWAGVLIFAGVLSSKLSDKFSIPVLLLFLAIGMLAGSEGLGLFYFDNANLAKSIGTVALIFIIFSGGLETRWKEVRPIFLQGMILSTLGVLLTAIVTGLFAVYILKFSLLQGMLLGAIVSSTDAAAVFTILRSKRLGLKPPLKPLLEFESGSNDPMAVFLTIGLIGVITQTGASPISLVPLFFLNMFIGGLIGYLIARFAVIFVNKVRLDFDGLYPVVVMSFAIFAYVLASVLHGNGILSVYVAGLMLGKAEFPNKRAITHFHGGVAWLMQIVMFVALGLLVFPSHIIPFIGAGLLITVLIIFIARPISVLLCLLPFRMEINKKVMVAWVGLRGAVPIILATFPFTAGIPQAETIFNVVFFVVIASVFIQGVSIPAVSKFLKVDVTLSQKVSYPIEFEKTEAIDAELNDIIVPYYSSVVGKTIKVIGVPDKCLIVLVSRNGKFIIPSGNTVLEGGDVLVVLANDSDLMAMQKIVSKLESDNSK